ncbi:MAG: M48 family metallopeptidase [Treponemataceae bacterium]|nr:M48 family metallopeptidase [Treponemataceae bacterium]
MKKLSFKSFLESVLLSVCSLMLFVSCESMNLAVKETAEVAYSVGLISEESYASVNETLEQSDQAMLEFTIEEEYYIGRGVAASILLTYPLYENPVLDAYLNKVLQVLVLSYGMPEKLNGYHIAVLDTDEINAFATCGGHILISRGFVSCVENEDQLAAVIAHELSHILLNHPIESIRADRRTNAFKALGKMSMNLFADYVDLAGQEDGVWQFIEGDTIRQMESTFSDLVGDSVNNLVNSGYSQNLEYLADEQALLIMESAGYSVHAMSDVLVALEKSLGRSKTGIGKTHPSPKARRNYFAQSIKRLEEYGIDYRRTMRFNAVKACL